MSAETRIYGGFRRTRQGFQPILSCNDANELKPNGEQQRNLHRYAGSCRFVYNKALALQQANHEAEVWDSYGLSQYAFRSGSFSEGVRGRWYFNVVVEVAVIPASGTAHVGLLSQNHGGKKRLGCRPVHAENPTEIQSDHAVSGVCGSQRSVHYPSLLVLRQSFRQQSER
ncbi:MAG: helix-turn-helix domain-containing protein [Thiothrix litoralis]|uniref:helix-turn-helix domain-containing protein n=1 Tax=Thiothrix litoralis TaxID=2891210 RepID=UPI003C782E31